MDDRIKLLLSDSRRLVSLATSGEEGRRCREASADYDFPGGYRRVYFHHIPKTAGISVWYSLLGLSSDEGGRLFEEIGASRNGRGFSQGRVVLGFNRPAVKRGHFYFGTSHIPSHFLSLPEHTFRFTCLRDPADRVSSLYRMSLDIQKSHSGILAMARERLGEFTSWLGVRAGDFPDVVSFAEHLPKRFLLNQVYMFSRDLDIDEAAKRTLDLEHVMWTDTFDEGMQQLGKKLGLDVSHVESNRSRTRLEPDREQNQALRDMLAPEYEFIALVQKGLASA